MAREKRKSYRKRREKITRPIWYRKLDRLEATPERLVYHHLLYSITSYALKSQTLFCSEL